MSCSSFSESVPGGGYVAVESTWVWRLGCHMMCSCLKVAQGPSMVDGFTSSCVRAQGLTTARNQKRNQIRNETNTVILVPGSATTDSDPGTARKSVLRGGVKPSFVLVGRFGKSESASPTLISDKNLVPSDGPSQKGPSRDGPCF